MPKTVTVPANHLVHEIAIQKAIKTLPRAAKKVAEEAEGLRDMLSKRAEGLPFGHERSALLEAVEEATYAAEMASKAEVHLRMCETRVWGAQNLKGVQAHDYKR